MRPTPHRVLLVGATGTIGRATLAALVERGHSVVCVGRTRPAPDWGAEFRSVDLSDEDSIRRACESDMRFDAAVSCLASRTGAPRDAWAVDHDAHQRLLRAAQAAGIAHFVLLSAICVQKPALEFQRAKLAFEATLMASGMRYSIVRPTAYFKSLSGQVARVQQGKPFLLFGDGALTACTPISDRDLADYIVGCLHDPSRWDRVLPIGGPGAPLTPRAQGELLFAALGQPPRFRHVPVALMDAIVAVLSAVGAVVPPVRAKAEFARIGRYYATESMLVWDAARGAYDAASTPSTGADTLAEHYAQLLRGETTAERGDHAVF
jgi:divinyl chlorophyllide a 8-vinyl-reductase